MIKIKDEIDLNILENFGFKRNKDDIWGMNSGTQYKDIYFSFGGNETSNHFLIVQDCYIGRPKEDFYGFELKNREISISIDEDYVEGKILDKLYDLIQAEIVEKVEEESK